MGSGMNLEEAKEYAKTMTYSEAVSNVRYSKGIKYRKATMIKLHELAEIADRLDRKTENSSEKPNNCEHITEDGVTCSRYPACDDCPDNPLNKVKGSERLLKGKTELQTGMSEIDKMIKIVDGILGDDDLCEGRKDGREGLSCAECRRKYADKIIKILRKTKTELQTDCQRK